MDRLGSNEKPSGGIQYSLSKLHYNCEYIAEKSNVNVSGLWIYPFHCHVHIDIVYTQKYW